MKLENALLFVVEVLVVYFLKLWSWDLEFGRSVSFVRGTSCMKIGKLWANNMCLK